jgi:hypothetical protein
MSKKRIYLVTATRATNQEEFAKRPIYKSLEKLYRVYSRDEFEFEVIKNNTEGLSTVYNKFITEEHINDIVLFVHDDIILDTFFLVEHLNKSPYTVTGLAGSAYTEVTPFTTTVTGYAVSFESPVSAPTCTVIC